MGLLNRFFKSQEAVAKDIKLKDDEFIKIWRDYHSTVDEKEKLIGSISPDNFKQLLPQLKKLLSLELSDIEGEEKTEEALIGDLQSIEHEKRIEHVQRLYERLCYVESKYKYIYELLNVLHSALTAQLYIVERLNSSTDPATLIMHLKSQFEVEKETLRQIESRETFHELFLALVKGEHVVGIINAKEKQLLKRMEVVMQSVVSDKRKKGMAFKWADRVLKGIQEQMGEYIARHVEDEVGNNPHVDFEFVNHTEFVGFVKQCAAELGETPSEQMVNVFVHVFREWYNLRD